jgi:pimeloyl-ACP methyl ester carboxylesterase
MWGPVTRTLARRFTVIRPEIGDCGTLAAAAEDVAAELTSRRLTRVGLAGLSMGGYVAFELLRLWPQGVRAAALLDTTAFPDTADRREKRHQVLLLARQGRFEEVLATFVTSVLAPGHAGEGPTRDLLLTMARDLGPEAFARDVEAILKRGSYEDVLQLVRVPLLFVAGEHDSLTPPAVARQMEAEVPSSRVAVVPGAGHMSALEKPEEVAELLEAFFGSILGDA